MTAILYQTTNLLNGKIYVGVDGKCDREYLGSGKALKLAIRKHGRENFHRRDLAAFDTIEEAYEAERVVVTQTWVDDSANYNLCGGGLGARQHSAEARRKMSQVNSRPKPYSKETVKHAHRAWKGGKHTQETLSVMSKKASGENNPFYGKRHTPESRAKMSKACRLYWQKRKLARQGVNAAS